VGWGGDGKLQGGRGVAALGEGLTPVRWKMPNSRDVQGVDGRKRGTANMRTTVLAAMAATAILTSAALAPARGQVILTQPGEIAGCLCLQQSVTALDGDVVQRRQVEEQRRQEVDALDAEVSAQRSHVDVNNFDQVQAFKRLIDKRDRAAADFAGPVTASYADAVARYNAAVNQYNASCASKSYDQAALARAQTGLSCPPSH
jgi:hypothetical protein